MDTMELAAPGGGLEAPFPPLYRLKSPRKGPRAGRRGRSPLPVQVCVSNLGVISEGLT